MKYLYLIAALLGVALSWPSPITAQSVNPAPVEDEHNIKLEAETEDERAKMLLVPFEAWKHAESVSVSALTTTEASTFSVFDATGAVCVQTTAALACGKTVILPLSGLPQGNYTLCIQTGLGIYFYGSFER